MLYVSVVSPRLNEDSSVYGLIGFLTKKTVLRVGWFLSKNIYENALADWRYIDFKSHLLNGWGGFYNSQH